MTDTSSTILCISSYHKGMDFMREAADRGWQVILLTDSAIADADWPWESISEFFHMPDLSVIDDVIKGVSYLARRRNVDRVVALDDYDVMTAAHVREHMCLPGMGVTAMRRFRDKLAMRVGAHAGGIRVPDFIQVLNDERVHEFTQRVPPPWVLKPRAEASTIGIQKVESTAELWPLAEELGDRRSFHVLERFVPGTVYHVDSIIARGRVEFAEVHQYGRPPLETFHGGGIAMSRTVRRGSDDDLSLRALNDRVVDVLGATYGITHAEFIKGAADGELYFLEVAARVGGAHTVEMIEATTGINLWREWARMETMPDPAQYDVSPERRLHGGIVLSLARQEWPDTSTFDDPEIAWRLHRHHHVGFVVTSPEQERVEALLADYSRRIAHDFQATLPPWQSRPSPVE